MLCYCRGSALAQVLAYTLGALSILVLSYVKKDLTRYTWPGKNFIDSLKKLFSSFLRKHILGNITDNVSLDISFLI